MPEKIAVVAADPEPYWDMFKSHMDVEGIPVDKPVVAKGVPSLFPRLAVALENFIEGLHIRDLESFLCERHYFNRDKQAYVHFKNNFSKIYDFENVESLIGEKSQWDASAGFSFSDFISFLYATWSHTDYTLYNKLVDALIKDYKMDLRLSLSRWHSYLMLLIAKMETTVEPGQAGGVAFVGAHQLDHLEYDHLILIGCHRSALQTVTSSPFTPEDVSSLDRDLGYYLPPYEDKKIELDFCGP